MSKTPEPDRELEVERWLESLKWLEGLKARGILKQEDFNRAVRHIDNLSPALRAIGIVT